MTEGIIQGITGSLGAEFTELGGFRSTRIQAQFETQATQVAYGTDDATGNSTGTTVTVTSALVTPLPSSITAAHRFRSLSPLQYAYSVNDSITSRDSATQLTLGGGVFTKLVSSSWEVYDPAAIASLTVETTHEWEDDGYFVLDGGLYRYTGKGINTLNNVEYFNGEVWTYQLPADTVFEVGDEVVDFTRAYSGVDKMRRGFLLPYAEGTDLNTIGRNLSVPRPPTEVDSVYRKIVTALAYMPKGTMWAIEALLTAVLGEGNYEIFEDLTQPGTVPYAANHQSIIYVSGQATPTQSVGKTFIHASEYAPLITATTLDVSTEPLSMIGVRLAPEPLDRLVASGTVASGTFSSVTHVTSADLSGAVGKSPQRGDTLHINRGRGFVRVGPIKTSLGFGAFELADIDDAPAMSLRENFTGTAWKVTRASTGCKFGYRPSTDYRVEYPGHGGRQMWTYQGTTPETTHVTLPAFTAVDGQCALFTEDTADGSFQAYYKQDARIVQQSDATFTAVVRLEDLDNTKKGQFSQRIADGSRLMAVGATVDSGAMTLGFYDPNNIVSGQPWLTSGGNAQTITPNDWHTVEILKCTEPNAWTTTNASVTIEGIPQSYVQLRVDGNVIEEQPYTNFPLLNSGSRSVGFVAASSQSLANIAGDAGPLSVPNQDVTAAVWFRTTASSLQQLYHLEADTVGPGFLTDALIYMGAAGDVYAALSDGTGTLQQVGSIGTHNDGNWHLATLIWSGNTLQLYVDAVFQASTAAVNRYGSDTAPQYSNFYLGTNDTTGFFFDGRLDEASYWDDSFGLGEVQELYNSGVPTDLAAHSKYGNLQAWWRLGEAANDSTDSSDPAARIHDVGPGAYNINLTPYNMTTANIVPGVGASGQLSGNTRAIGIFEAPNNVDAVKVRLRQLDWSAQTSHDAYNRHVTQANGSYSAGALTDADSAAFSGAVAGDLIRVAGVSNVGSAGVAAGNLLGEWAIDGAPAAAVASITGAIYERGNVDPHAKDILYVRGERIGTQDPVAPQTFRYPDAVGRTVGFTTGENAGEYRVISQLLDPVTGADLALSGNHGQQAPVWTNRVKLSSAFINETTDAAWQFTTAGLVDDTNVEFEVVSQGSIAVSTITLPEDFSIPLYSGSDGPLMEASYAEVLSAQVIDEGAVNTTNATPGYKYYPFYLADEFGWLREAMDLVTVAGVHVNLNDFFRDSAGPHIL